VRVHPREGNVTRVAFSERKILGGELEGHLDITRRQVRMRYVLQGIGLEDLPENQGNSVRVQGRVSGSLALDIRVDEEGHWADDWHLAADAEVSPLKIIGGRKADPWWLDFPQARVKGQGLLHSVREDGITLSGDWNISLAKIRTSWFPEGQDALEGLFSGVLAWPPRPGGFVETNRGRQGVERVSGALALTGSLIVPLGSERVPLTGKMNALLDWNLFQDVVTLDQTAFEGLGGFVGGQVRVEAAGDGVTVTAPLNFKLAPRVLLKAWNLLPSGGVRMPATLTGTARVTGSGGRVTFADLALQVDGDPLEGEIVVSGGQQGPREKAAQAAGGSHWVFRLSSRRLNLDTFFPPATPEERAKPPSPEPWNLSFLGGLSLEAELSTKAAKFHGLNLADSRTVAALQRGRFSLQIETADFYGGVSTLLAQGSFVPERSQLYLSKLLGEMRGIALGRVIQDSTGADAYGGTADILFDLSGAMRSDADLYAGLSGIWSLKIADGVYPAFLGSETAGLRNTFAHASVSGAMDKGVLKADNFVLRGMMVDMSGDGWVDLGRRALDLHLNVTIAKVPTVPVRFYGSLDSPSMYLRGAHMVVDTAQAAGSTVFGLVRGILELPARALNSLISPGESGKTQ
ncbi:MAG: hypothetical protein LBP61_04260, partial [Desulfovibrio sp.]|jgi:AsmA protein|nr:hypothetical protein [Desulfovibrio sp.]